MCFCCFFFCYIICKLMTCLPGSTRPNSYMEFMQIITSCILDLESIWRSLPCITVPGWWERKQLEVAIKVKVADHWMTGFYSTRVKPCMWSAWSIILKFLAKHRACRGIMTSVRALLRPVERTVRMRCRCHHTVLARSVNPTLQLDVATKCIFPKKQTSVWYMK